MGTELEVRFPPLAWHPYRHVAKAPESVILRDLEFPTAPRFLVSAFVRDRPGLLRSVLRVLNSGVVVSAPSHFKASERTVRFSLDGTLSAAVDGAFVLAFVARAIVREELLAAHPLLMDELALSLKSQIALSLALTANDEELIDPVVSTFTELPDSIFENRRFAEFRFGVRRLPDWRQRLSDATVEFCKVLAKASVPIAYLYFPDSGEPDSFAWVRFGVGATRGAAEMAEVDLSANSIALSHSMRFDMYDAASSGFSMMERMTVIADYTPAGSECSECQLDDVDVVFVQGPARPGFVASMIGASAFLQGGSMTVLAGHTVACWVVPKGHGDGLISSIEGRSEQAHGLDTVILRRLGPVGAGESRPSSFWLSWVCEDRPGVFYRLLEDLTEAVDRLDGVKANVRFSISRVLADGKCAGKLKFEIDETVSERLVGELSRLEGMLQDELRSATNESAIVVLAQSEPREEPWGSLPFG